MVGVGLPVIGSGIVLGTCTGTPSTFTVINSTGAGVGFGSVAAAALDILCVGVGGDLHIGGRSGSTGAATPFIIFPAFYKIIFELAYETLHWP